MVRWMFCLVLVAACAGCARQGPSALEVKLASMVGESEADVVREFGVPNRTFETGGDRFIAYIERRQDVVPSGGPWGPPWWGWSNSQVITRSCEITFEIAAGRVKSYGLRGDACG